MTFDPRIGLDPDHGWHLLAASLEDSRLTHDDLVVLVTMAVEMYSPGPADPKRVQVNQRWLDTIIKSRGNRSGSAPDERPARRVSADEIVRAHRVATGEVIPLPDNQTARAIIRADAKRRNERGSGD